MSRCIDVYRHNAILWPDFSSIKPGSLHMTRKQATIAVRSGLNDDEQYGCVVPPIH
ncbi:MAG TPA: cystathionine gamma-synthase, partial [Escherichia sp.]|nr:cystathionine gamma-synthase [Escherichia sp.]